MRKPLFATLYVLSLLAAVFSIHQAFAQRSPAVEPIVEIAIDNDKTNEKGFNFTTEESKRIPANITTKSGTQNTPYSYIGPLIFLIALPISLWIIVAKKIKNSESGERVNYYSNTFQFKSSTNIEQTKGGNDVEDDDDHDFPKAS